MSSGQFTDPTPPLEGCAPGCPVPVGGDHLSECELFEEDGLRVLVCGDRHYADEQYVHSRLDEEDVRHGGFTFVIDGTADGADSFGHSWARRRGRQFRRFRPHWRHDFDCVPGCQRPVGKVAGVLRNQEMLDEGKPHLVIAFHDHIEDSRGTVDMMRRARKAGLNMYLYDGGPYALMVDHVSSTGKVTFFQDVVF